MASFRTAYLQREIILDCAVKGTVNTPDASQTALGKAFALRVADATALTAIKVGDLVIITPSVTSESDVGLITTLPASMKRTLFLEDATHIVAQSDNTLEYGHIPVENRDYRYFPMVNGTYASSLASSTPVKKVAVFKITNKDDVILDASQGEAEADESKNGAEGGNA